jgi:hypothetical protein
MNKLILAFIILTATGSLHSMESDQIIELPQSTPTHHLSPISLPVTYHYLRNFLHREIIQLIVSFYRDIDFAEIKIEQICKDSNSFIKSIQTTLASYGSALTPELYKLHLCNVSLCDIKNFYGETPLGYVIKNIKDAKSCSDLVQILIKIAGNNAWRLLSEQDEYRHTVLHTAASLGYTDVIKFLLNAAGNNTWTLLTMENKYSNTALHLAAIFGRSEVVKILLEAAGDNTWTLLTMRDKYNETALHFAAKYGHPEVVKILLDAAGHKVQDFMAIRMDFVNKTALDIANLEARAVMEKYLPKNQSFSKK